MTDKQIKPTKVWVSVGANVADRYNRVAETLRRLANTFESVEVSSIYESDCWQKKGPKYSNAVAFLYTDKPLEALLAMFKNWERENGRLLGTKTVEVPLDIDVVVYDGKVLRPSDFERPYFEKGYRELNHPSRLRIENYTYPLDNNRIALHPLQDRDLCKLLVINRDGTLTDTIFRDIASYLPDDGYLIYNNTRVINARIQFVKSTGAKIEIFCLEPVLPADYQLNFASTVPVVWKCLVGNSKRWHDENLVKELEINGSKVILAARRISNNGAHSEVEFSWDNKETSFSDIINSAGEIPIPPYLDRRSEESDNTDYQTVYGLIEGSVAAPTAGLHFTESLLEKLAAQGARLREVTLHVGAGTFRPVKSDTMEGHEMHSELIDVPLSLIEEIARTERPITAVGTTTIRTLESLYHIGCKIIEGQWTGTLDQWYPYEESHPQPPRREALEALAGYLRSLGLSRLVASTRIIIAPGYKFKVTDNLITNFHQPGSTLLLLIAAIVGDDWRRIYDHALAHDYRFLSYGDACLFRFG